MSWWRRLFHDDRLERELEAELRFHFDRQVEDNVRAGMSEREARRAARLQFGGLDQVKEDCRDARGTRWLVDLGRDVRFAARLLAKEPAFTAVAVVALALGMGVNNTFFTVVNAVCIRGLPIPEPDRVVYVSTRDTRERDQGLSHPDFRDMRAATESLAGLAAFTTAPMILGDEHRTPERVLGAYISTSALDLLRERPLLGRSFQPEDESPGAPAVVILGGGVWRTRYGADPAMIGRTIRVNSTPSIVVGVMTEGFRFPNNADVWQPLSLLPGLASRPRDARILGVFGRLKDHATIAEAGAELAGIAERLSRLYPGTNGGIGTAVVAINERYNGRLTDPVWIAFMTAGILVLLIACANVANLLLMRATRRSREIAIRVSLGGTRMRVIRQLLVESTLLATLAGILGFGLSLLGARLLSSTLTESAPYWMRFTMDARVFLALAAVCLGSVVVFGLVPAVHLATTDVNQVLQSGGRSATGGPRARRWTAAFLTAEFALTVVLLAAVLHGFRNFRAALESDVVIDTAELLTMWVSLPPERYPTPERRTAFFDGLTERFRHVGVISSAALATALPFSGATPRGLELDGRPGTGDTPPTVSTLTVSPGYFATLRLSMLRGRDFTDRDGTAGQEHVIVNQRFVARHFPGEDPVGRRIRVRDPREPGTAAWLTIVGVCPSVRQRPQGIEPEPVVYLPWRAAPPATAALILRSSGDPASLATLMRQELRALDPELPLYRVITLDRVVSQSRMAGRISQALITIIACIALSLAIVGLHAVTAHAVAQRTHEIGIRMALGARPAQVLRLVLQRAGDQLALGVLAGFACTIAWERLLGNASQRYKMTDPIVLIVVAVLVTVVALAACFWPARRASLLDPALALRYE